MLRNHNFNIFFQKKAISLSCMLISGYDIIYNFSASNHQQLQARRFVTPPDSSWKMKRFEIKDPFLKKISCCSIPTLIKRQQAEASFCNKVSFAQNFWKFLNFSSDSAIGLLVPRLCSEVRSQQYCDLLRKALFSKFI